MMTNTELLQKLNPSAIDQILLQLAFNTMRVQSYRHGAFLDAAATAAKCTVYLTYLEQNQNLRITGQLHHIEPKRVKVIVDEVRQALTAGKLLKMLGSQEPRYLIQFPHVWLEHYPWQLGKPRMAGTNLHQNEEFRLAQHLPDHLPDAQIINSFQLHSLIAQLYERSQEAFPLASQLPLSDAMADHIERCLIHSGTIAKVEAIEGISFYALIREYYAPIEQHERIATMMEDTAHYFELLQQWVDRQPQCKRIMEELDIPPHQVDQAIAELDRLIQAWANRHHQPQGVPFVVQIACGVVAPPTLN